MKEMCFAQKVSGEIRAYFFACIGRPSLERQAIAHGAGTCLTKLGSVIICLFIKNKLLFTIAPGIGNHGLEQLTSVTHFDEQNME